jgi:molybdopterin-containing oxidoreductase family iron-sulfur binding subunit
METNQDLSLAQEQTGQPDGKVGRRRMLKLFGLGALSVAPLPLLPNVLSSVLAPRKGPVRADYDPALAPNGRVRRWTMIIDLRYCDGCQSVGKPPQCTTACIEGHFAPEPMQWIEVFEAPLHGGGTQFIPAPCQQCQNPPCTNVCPVGATFATPEGSILIDQNRCIGCRICMAACPYDRRFFNWGDAPIPPEAMLAHYDIEHQTPAKRGTVMKCDFCPDMARAGTLPYCAQGCPNKAIYYGDLEQDVATNGKDIVSVSRFLSEHEAYNLKEDLGTKPRVYYVPGHGEFVGRDSAKKGRMATVWPWVQRAKGAKTWKR